MDRKERTECNIKTMGLS